MFVFPFLVDEFLFFLNVFKMEGMSGGFGLLYQDLQDVFLRIVKE